MARDEAARSVWTMTASAPAPATTTTAAPVAGTAAIETQALGKRYGRHPALVDLDLRVERGEVFGFIGPNGAGKTTTIRLLLDLIRPSAGTARVLGLDARRDGVEVRRRVGYLPGDLALYEDLTAAEQLAYLARLRGLPGLDVRPLAERLSLDLHRPIRALSRGNRQKVGLVQAFMHDPELLILDEPTSGLDPLIQHEFAAMVGEARERGRTVFLSSHVLGDVERLADRVGLLRAGRLVLVDDVGALKARVTRRIELHFETPPPAGAIPMGASVLAHTLRERRRGLLGWSLGVAALAALIAAYWPSVRDSADLQSFTRNLPEAMRALIGGGDYSTAAGFLNAELFAFMMPLLFLVVAIGMGARAVVGEEERGTIDLLLSTPLTRRRMLVEKALGGVLVLLALGGVLFAALLLGGAVVDMGIRAGRLAAISLAVVLVALPFGALAPLIGSLDRWQDASPFAWYASRDVLAGHLSLAHVALLVGTALVLAAAAVVALERRDLRT
jgi:ABC-2 type transport system ATP-binding protein